MGSENIANTRKVPELFEIASKIAAFCDEMDKCKKESRDLAKGAQ